MEGMTPEARAQRDARVKEKQAYRRAWVSRLFYGGLGHLASFLIVTLGFLAGLASLSDPRDPVVVLELVRWVILVHFVFAVVINAWYYRDEIKTAKARERSIPL